MLITHIPLHCVNEAAIRYHVPAKLIIAVLETEQGKIGGITINKNGTYDIGPMAINSLWLPELKKHGITEHDIQFDPCMNLKVGVWILSKKIANQNNVSVGIGNYNSHNIQLNAIYYNKVKVNFFKVTNFLNS